MIASCWERVLVLFGFEWSWGLYGGIERVLCSFRGILFTVGDGN